MIVTMHGCAVCRGGLRGRVASRLRTTVAIRHGGPHGNSASSRQFTESKDSPLHLWQNSTLDCFLVRWHLALSCSAVQVGHRWREPHRATHS